MNLAIYKPIDADKYRNVWVVGDIHGSYTALMHRLDRIEFDTEQDLLVSVGDLIDRGSENAKCLELIDMPWFEAVRGNHEQMAYDALSTGNVQCWLSNGGSWYYTQDADEAILAKSMIMRVNEMPHILQLSRHGKKIVIAHADYPGNNYLFGKPVCAGHVIWDRERLSDSIDGHASEILGADHFYFGHSPVSLPATFANQTYIDTGCVFTGRLTVMKL